jgi:hypothetical protein
MILENLYDGLQSRSTNNYTINQSTRVEGTLINRTIDINLPLFLSPETWERHQYSKKDIFSTLECFPSTTLWRWALFHGIPPTSSAIKPTSMDVSSIIHVSKSVVIKKIMKYVQTNYPSRNLQSVLDLSRRDFKPRLPVHALDEMEWLVMLAAVPTAINYSLSIEYQRCFKFRDVDMVPLENTRGQIYAVRIVRKSAFVESGRHVRKTKYMGPLDIQIAGETYHNVDEACLFELGRPSVNNWDK